MADERLVPRNLKEVDPTYFARYNLAKKFIERNSRVLDVPCGTGYGLKIMDKSGCLFVGLDISPEAIKHAENFFRQGNNIFLAGDAQNMSMFPDNSFDVIVSFEGIEHLKKDARFLKECRRLLARGGKLIISTPRKPHGNPFHVREYSLNQFKKLLSSYFRVERLYGQIYDRFVGLGGVNPFDYKKFNFLAVCVKD